MKFNKKIVGSIFFVILLLMAGFFTKKYLESKPEIGISQNSDVQNINGVVSKESLGAYVGNVSSGPGSNYKLTIKRSGGGTIGGVTGGNVTASYSKSINCGNVCSANYKPHTMVTLSASSNSTSKFTGWTVSGGHYCVDKLPCSFEMDSNIIVTATWIKALCPKGMSSSDSSLYQNLLNRFGKTFFKGADQAAMINRIAMKPGMSKEEKDSWIKMIQSSSMFCFFKTF